MIKAKVALCSPPFATLTYTVPAWLTGLALEPGLRVVVPLGKGLRVGLITAIEGIERPTQEQTQGSEGLQPLPPTPQQSKAAGKDTGYALKPILWPLEKSPLLSASYLDLATQIALRQGLGLGQILGNVLPQGLRSIQARVRFFSAGSPQTYSMKGLSALPEATLLDLGELWAQGRGEVLHAVRSPIGAELCQLNADPPWPVRPRATSQLAVLEYLLEHGATRRSILLDALGKAVAPGLITLAAKGLVSIRPADGALPVAGGSTSSQGLPPYFALSPHQQTAFAPLREAALAHKATTHLLFGITGSGKTALYLELAREVLNQGRSVLLLAPEVALAMKLWNEAATALPMAKRFFYHGYQAPGLKESTFLALAEEKTPVLVVGTRSALFLPLQGAGLIVLDEEHDSSFKQDEGFTYQAKEVAWYRAVQDKALLLLGSATPDVKTFHAAKQGHVPMHILSQRNGEGTLPEIQLVPLPKARQEAGLLVPQSRQALLDTISRGEQAVILLNRRGYAPLMYCLACATVAKCPHCDIALAYHKGRERLLCHYCGHSMPFPSPCASCKGLHYLPMGEGTEKIEEDLAAFLPAGARVLRLDKDSTRRPGRMEEILAAFARQEASVLVGTQMLSKGHHFPAVTLVVVADGDLGLNMPDYRAAERTFQLLVQSAGRAGRGDKPGQVLIQTRDPSHYCWHFVQQADYPGFFEKECALRQKRVYPPFIRLALIRISYAMEETGGAEALGRLGNILRAKGKELGVTVLGPAPAPLPLLQGRRRFHCLAKADNWGSLRTLYSSAAHTADIKCLRLRLDLDPVNML